ncbi:hypothetical protein ACLQ24_29065 [Micromonospora sp. DT4]|uniref:hypothetical protein n=1 Tax=Micromonospora sp. DT4 TaxID=3393438 RepID=UPI003CF44957
MTWQVKNYSQAPIFDVRINFYATWSHDVEIRFSDEPESVAVIEEVARGEVAIPPTEIGEGAGYDLSRFTINVGFTDASGVRWKRFGNYPPERHFDFHPPTKEAIRRSQRRQRVNLIQWKLGRWKLWTQVKVLRTRKPEELEAYGTEYDDIPF